QQQQQRKATAAAAASLSSKKTAAVPNSNRSGGSSSAAAAASTQQQQQQIHQRRPQQLKKHQTFQVSDVPEDALLAFPSLAQSLEALQSAESTIGQATERILTLLRDTHNPCLHLPANRQSLPLLLSRCRLRIFIYNTHANQQPPPTVSEHHAPHFQVPPLHELQPPAAVAAAAAAATAAAAAAAAAAQQQQQQQQQLLLPPPALTSLVQEPPPSWALHIKGQALDKQVRLRCCLSSFFERIVVLTGSQTVAWHWGGGDPVEELVLQRRGDTPLTLKILFFLKHRLPTFGLSPQLSAVCAGQRQLSLCSVLRCIFSYCLTKGLVLSGSGSSSCSSLNSNSGKPNYKGVRFRTDELLRRVFGSDVQTFGLPDLPELLRQHLLPPTPVVITHNLRLSGDWLESEHTYDFSLDCIDTTCSGSSNCSAISSAATACCVLGLESWLAAPHQHALSPAQQQKQLALNAEMDTLDSQLTLLLQQIHQRVAQMQLYSALAKDPKEPWLARAVGRYLQRKALPLEDQICKVFAAYGLADPRKRQREVSVWRCRLERGREEEEGRGVA
ncbi:uncharacterized protein LOC34624264, partial [Cyclospora cayetanensis]|uniref:Uncharacterized protein LOC34624264 n=1 Tax=Cyclospora cayetanensis TaxID=88456 RepID=A0A6P6RSW5_9EIME